MCINLRGTIYEVRLGVRRLIYNLLISPRPFVNKIILTD